MQYTYMEKIANLPILFKLLIVFLAFFIILPLSFLFFMEIYLNNEKKDMFQSAVSITEGGFDRKLDIIKSEREGIASDKRVTFTLNAELSDEVWSRDSFYVEYIRGKDNTLSNFHQGYISNFYKVSEDKLFLENRRSSNQDIDYFKIKVSTLPLDRRKENILIVGDSFVAGQNFIDENRIFYKIFADKIKELHKEHYFNIISAGRNGWGFHDYVLNATNLATEIDIDFLVIGFLPNDYRNTDIGILSDGYNTLSNNGLVYVNCINGRVWLSSLLLKSYSIFPKSSKALIMRYCDKYLSGIGDARYPLNNDEAIALFEDALRNLERFSKKNGFEVIFMPLNPMENSGIIRDFALYELIKEIGFDIIPSTLSDLIVSERSKIGWVTPIDWHPSVLLSYAYGMDMYNYFVDRFNISGIENKSNDDYTYRNKFELFNYVSSIKPNEFNYKFGVGELRLDNIDKVSSSTNSGYFQFLPIKENEELKEKVYPDQSALCAKINRAHIEIAINKMFINNSKSFTVKNNHNVNSIIVAPKGYSSSGEDLYRQGYLLLPGEYIILNNEGNLIIASTKEGCEVDEEIKLPEFDVSIMK